MLKSIVYFFDILFCFLLCINNVAFAGNFKNFFAITYYGELINIQSINQPNKEQMAAIYTGKTNTENLDLFQDWYITLLSDKNAKIISQKKPLVCVEIDANYYDTMGLPELVYFLDFDNKKIYNKIGDLLYDDEIIEMTKQSINVFDRDSVSVININLKSGLYLKTQKVENTSKQYTIQGYCSLKNSYKDMQLRTFHIKNKKIIKLSNK